MGLDLYIEKRKRKDSNYGNSRELAYFRKVNFLIPYFEKYFDVEMENCKYYPLTKEYCEDLLETCEEVNKNNELASKLLPTQEGFFFGNTKYDYSYFDDIIDVIEQLKSDVIPEFDNLKEDEEISFHIWF